MLINLSNHPSSLWSGTQIQEALNIFGTVADMPFPPVPPEAESEEIAQLAEVVAKDCLQKIRISADPVSAVHIMGELTLCFTVTALLQKDGITCIASTSVRNVEVENGIKSSVFSFCRFRAYPCLNHGN